MQCRPQPVDARAVCDASGARGGFFRRRGRTADATAARPTYAPFCVLARASACTTFAVVRAPLIVLRADPISTFKGKKASAASRPGNPNRSSPTVSDPRVGPPLRYRPDKFSRRIFCSSYDAAVLPAYESRENDRVFSSLRKRKNFEIFSTRSDGGDIEAGDGACRERGMAGRPWGKCQKNDKVFSFLRKRKNFEIFSTCSDGGGIGNGERACWKPGMACRPMEKKS